MDIGLRRCPHCRAFDAWTGRQRREDLFEIIVIAHECGICGKWWRVPIPQPVRIDDVRRP